jgi:TPR repeat protein
MDINQRAFVVAVVFSAFILAEFAPAPAEAGGYARTLMWKKRREKESEARKAEHDAELAAKRKRHQEELAAKRKFDPATQALRMRMFAGKPLTQNQLKFLADKGESLAAYRLAQLIVSKDGSRDTALHYLVEAAAAGRKGAIKPMIGLLRAPGVSLKPTTIAAAKAGLLTAVKKGNSDAMIGLAQLYLAGKPLGGDAKMALDLLVEAAKHGDEDAALEAGLMLAEGNVVAPNGAKAVEMLKIAAKRGNLLALAKLETLTVQ